MYYYKENDIVLNSIIQKKATGIWVDSTTHPDLVLTISEQALH